MLRLLRVTVVLLVGFGAFAGAVVYGSRLPDLPVCVTISNNTSGDLLIYDALHDQVMPERRYSPLRTPVASDGSPSVTVFRVPNSNRRYRMTLELPDRDEALVLEEAVYQPYEYWYGDRVSFSDDQQKVAYLWRQNADADEQITIFDVEDGSRRTAVLPDISTRNDGARLVDWSHGADYLTLLSPFEPLGTTYHLWSVEAMEPVTFPEDIPPITTGSWSPQGEIFAGVTQVRDGDRWLVLFSTDQPENILTAPLGTDITSGIAWSPDGQKVMLARRALSRRNGQASWQWYFDLFSADAAPIQRDIRGQYLPYTDPTLPAGFSPELIPGFWSLDSQSWLFTRNNANNQLSHLARLDTDTGAIEVIEDGLLTSMLPHVYFMPTIGRWFSSTAYMPDNTQILLPLWRDDALTLEYVNLEQDWRTVLLQGITRFLGEAVQNSLWMFSWAGDHFVIPYVDAGGVNHLRIVRRGDGSIVADVGGMDSLLNVRYLGRWVGFTAWRSGAAAIELIDLETGEHRQLLDGVEGIRSWDSLVSPDGQHMALVLWETNLTASVGRAQMSIVSLADGTSHQFGDAAFSYPLWSPDGTMLAYLFVHRTGSTGLRVVNTRGETVQQSVLPHGMLTERSIYTWSRCEPNPQRVFGA